MSPLARKPDSVKLAYTTDSIWRNRDQFLQGRDEIAAFLTKKWEKEQNYRLRKELFSFTDNKARIIFASNPPCFLLRDVTLSGSQPTRWSPFFLFFVSKALYG